MSSGFYQILDGIIFDKALLSDAEAAAADGKIGYEAAKFLWTKVGDETGHISEVDLRTVDYILAHHKLEDRALLFLQEALKIAKQEAKAKARADAKAAGISPVKSPKKSPRAQAKPNAKAEEDPYTAIMRIQEAISSAGTISQVKRLTQQLEKYSPMKATKTLEEEVEEEIEQEQAENDESPVVRRKPAAAEAEEQEQENQEGTSPKKRPAACIGKRVAKRQKAEEDETNEAPTSKGKRLKAFASRWRDPGLKRVIKVEKPKRKSRKPDDLQSSESPAKRVKAPLLPLPPALLKRPAAAGARIKVAGVAQLVPRKPKLAATRYVERPNDIWGGLPGADGDDVD